MGQPYNPIPKDKIGKRPLKPTPPPPLKVGKHLLVEIDGFYIGQIYDANFFKLKKRSDNTGEEE